MQIRLMLIRYSTLAVSTSAVKRNAVQGVQFLFFFYFFLFFEPTPIFSYFLTKTSYFSCFLAGEAKICSKIENGMCF